ncbi:MAG: hypothetical protein LV473_21760 [Nitrospira sp.]|nr:hypothetical protein [Nitrospira sp.]
MKNAVRLERLSLHTGHYDESWLQSLCYDNPTLLPIEEIEPSFAGIVPICRELQTDSGACDLIYLNENGFITIGECKLWRNPEARRQVVGQVLDYAKDLCKWTYSKLEQECLKARKGPESSLYSVVAAEIPELDEQKFIDHVQRNLTLGRFLLLIIGDGIRENMEGLVQYIQGQGALHFSVSLLEMPIFKGLDDNDLLITPRVLVKTKEIERTIVRVVDHATSTSLPQPGEPVARTVSEAVFYERLALARGKNVADNLETFLDDLRKDLGLLCKLGRGIRLSLNIKSPNDTYNFGSIQQNGEVWFYGSVTNTDRLGGKQIGLSYLKDLALLVGGELDTSLSEWVWGVKRHQQYMKVDDYLTHSSEWRRLIQKTLQTFQQAEDA